MALRDSFDFNEEPVYLMDGNAFIFRAFFANSRMARSDSFPTGAIYSVGRLLLKILREEKPKYFCFVLDGQGKNFRHEIYPEYKAQRPEAPEDLKMQFEPIKQMVQRFGIKLEVSDNCEADDCIASLAKKFSAERPVVIVGVDKDLRQCLNENVIMWDPASKSEKIVTAERFTEETGLLPNQWADVQALIGDSSDNIPGVKGIGEKTAIKIFQEYFSLEEIKANYENLAPPVKKKMEGNLEAMFLYRQLTTLDTAKCLDLDLNSLELEDVHQQNALAFLGSFELNSLIKDFNSLVSKKLIKINMDSASQGILNSEQKKIIPLEAQEIKLIKAHEIPNLSNKIVSLIPCNLKNPEQGFYLSISPLPKNFKPVNQEQNSHNFKNKSTNLKAKKPKKEQMQQQSLFALIDQKTSAAPVNNNNGLMEEILDSQKSGQQIDFHYVGDFDELIPHLTRAGQIVLCGLKDLMHKYPLLATTFNNYQQFFDLSVAAWLLSPDEKDYAWLTISLKHALENNLSNTFPSQIALSLYQQKLNSIEEQNL